MPQTHLTHTLSSDIQQHLLSLKDRLKEEEKLSLEFMQLRGIMDLLLSASNVEAVDIVDEQSRLYDNLQVASEDAKRKSIISVE